MGSVCGAFFYAAQPYQPDYFSSNLFACFLKISYPVFTSLFSVPDPTEYLRKYISPNRPGDINIFLSLFTLPFSFSFYALLPFKRKQTSPSTTGATISKSLSERIKFSKSLAQ